MTRWAPLVIAAATLLAGSAAAVYYSSRRPGAEPLRRARAPRRGAPYPRQPDAWMAADWRRLASLPASPEHDPGAGGRVVPIRRVGDRDIGGSDGGRRVGAGLVHHPADRLDRGRRGSRDTAPGEPERPLPAEHADDRAIAVRHDARRRGAGRRLGRSWRAGLAPGGGARLSRRHA